MTENVDWAPEDVDPSVPSAARVYDYYLGGSHNFAADRALAEQVMHTVPDVGRIAQTNRAFLRRAVTLLCESGVDQFLDLGSGIPTVGNVHEVVHALNPEARVVYVDRDPVAVTISRHLLAGRDGALVHRADLREPETVLADPGVRAFLDFERPIALLFLAVLHFVTDADRPAAEIVATFLDAVVAGSPLLISHATPGAGVGAARDAYRRSGTRDTLRIRSEVEIRELFGDTQLLEPGVVRIPAWRPEDPADVPDDVESFPGFAGVGIR